MKNTRKNYTRSRAQEQLFALEWIDLFTLFNIPNAAFKQMHDQAYAILYRSHGHSLQCLKRFSMKPGIFKTQSRLHLNLLPVNKY